MTKQRYEIGGYGCEMTEAEAGRWNAGEPTDADMATIVVHVGDERYITLGEATSYDRSPETAAAMDCMPANHVS